MDRDLSNVNSSEAQPTRIGTVSAILLGLLVFVVTPIIAAIITIPFHFLGKISESLNPTVIIANLFGLRDLGGFFAAQLILIGFLALLGDLATAGISWLIHRSKRFATVTFVSALIYQLSMVAVVLPAMIEKSKETMQSGIEHEQTYRQYAHIGDVRFDVQEPYSDTEIDNRYPEYGPKYNKLRIHVPVSVSQAGVYQIVVSYSFSKSGISGSAPTREVTVTLDSGEQTIQFEFLANEISSYGFWSPSSVGGIAEIQLFFLVSEKEMLDQIDSDSKVNQRILEQFLKDEGLDRRKASTEPNINKFIERKEVRF